MNQLQLINIRLNSNNSKKNFINRRNMNNQKTNFVFNNNIDYDKKKEN